MPRVCKMWQISLLTMRKRTDCLVQLRRDEVAHLRRLGLGKFIIGQTCTGKKYAEENRRILEALKKYNASGKMEVC